MTDHAPEDNTTAAAMSTPSTSQSRRHDNSMVSVVYVHKQDAKRVKSALQDAQLLDKNFRMVPSVSSHYPNTIALPVLLRIDEDEKDDELLLFPWKSLILGRGVQACPYSTKIMGRITNSSLSSSSSSSKTPTKERNASSAAPSPCSNEKNTNSNKLPYCFSPDLTLVQQAILRTVLTASSASANDDMVRSSASDTARNEDDDQYGYQYYCDRIVDCVQSKQLDRNSCPQKLEVFGDDRTLVIPPGAFDRKHFFTVLQSLIHSDVVSGSGSGDTGATVTSAESISVKEQEQQIIRRSSTRQQDDLPPRIIVEEFWRQLMAVHGSQRIVRRGTIDAESGIRQSGHRLVFPYVQDDGDGGGDDHHDDDGIPKTTGPGSPGWIRVTEQGIRQSFDMTRVMFSRGNISEKIRFGKRLVQKDEIILDMYAGIGYYTLPALIHGKAKHVVACEWNEHAIRALRFNVQDNHVEGRVTIFQGDCRTTAKEQHLVNMFDRVSLGLLPSSEGGWETAVRALKNETGGWLHVHGNVRDAEKEIWAVWLCQQLLDLCEKVGKPSEWIVLCDHVERVKSFAPTVSHVVADVFLGPASRHPRSMDITTSNSTVGVRAWLLLKEKGCIPIHKEQVVVPSCALSPDGVLSQSWMM